MERFESLLRNILTVAFSETEDVSLKNSCFAAQKQLIQAIKSVNEREFIEEIDAVIEKKMNPEDFENDSAVDLEASEFDTTGKLNSFLQKIEDNCKCSEQTGDRPNPYWCPNFANSLLRISKHFTLWTCILAPSGTIATSSRSEEYFSELKHLVLNDDRNLRVDKFLIKHIRSISGTEKLLNAACESITDKSEVNIAADKNSKFDNKSTDEILKSDETSKFKKLDIISDTNVQLDAVSKSNESEKSDEFLTQSDDMIEEAEIITRSFEKTYSFLNEEENWGGKNLPKKRRYAVQSPTGNTLDKRKPDVNLPKDEIKVKLSKRGKYLTPCPDIQSILEKPNKNANLPLLRNGQLLGRVRVARKDVTFYNTCSFDSLAQSVVAGYRDWANYHDYITVSKNEFYDFIRIFSKNGATARTYKKRSTILSNMFAMQNNRIDCHFNISNLVSQKLLTDEPSYQISQQCRNCEQDIIDNRPVIDINTKPFYEKSMQALQSSINEKMSDAFYNKCIRCGCNDVISKVSGGNHLFIDIECLQWLKIAENMGYENWSGLFTISQIPLRLLVGKLNYTLVSVIEYIGTSDPNDTGHYVAYIRRITGRWEIHNDFCADKKPILATVRALLEKRKMAMLMYVKQT